MSGDNDGILRIAFSFFAGIKVNEKTLLNWLTVGSAGEVSERPVFLAFFILGPLHW